MPTPLTRLVEPHSPNETAAAMLEKLRLHADAADLALDLRQHAGEVIAIDARRESAYAAGHIPGAINLPHRLMNADTTAGLDRSKLYIVYCDGIGCNASTWGTYQMAKLGFQCKELLGGLDFWLRDQLPVVTGEQPGQMPADGPTCAC